MQGLSLNAEKSKILQKTSAMTYRRKIGAVLIDLSGTIHIDDAVIPGAIQALAEWVPLYTCKLFKYMEMHI